MRKILLSAAGLVMAGVAGAQDKGTPPADPVSYIIGTNIASNMKSEGLDINVESLTAGLNDVLKGSGSKIAPAQAQEIMAKFQTEMQAKKTAKAAEAGKKNIDDGKSYLEKNGKAEGVKTTASGLQYSVIKEGSGEKPKSSDTVKVHYHGTLLDGTVFDSSVDRGMPASFPVDGVIKGWIEGLQLMTVGSKYKFVIPSELAYGERGAGGDIGPNAVLTFEVELLEIVKAGAEKAPE
jgi:FKBP-type peptidyl-prolyl cis-trans isomerase FklB